MVRYVIQKKESMSMVRYVIRKRSLCQWYVMLYSMLKSY